MANIKKVLLKSGKTRWRLRFYTGVDPDTGKQEIITRTFDRKKDAEREETRLKGQKDAGGVVTPSKERLGRYLRRWLDQAMKGRVRPRTWSDYSGVLRRYVEEPPEGAPLVGKVGLNRLGPDHLQSLYSYLNQDLGLSPRTVRSLHAVIRQGLAHAARTGAVARNVADLVLLPRQNRREVKALTQEEAARFLNAAQADRYHALWTVLLAGGLRPGEALGLRWTDVDLETGKIHVQRALTRRGVEGWELVEPKTSRGRRAVVIPAFVVEALREHRKVQAKERLKAGPEYANHDLVFATELGKPLDGANLAARNFNRIMAEAGLGEWEKPAPRLPGRPGPDPKPKFRAACRMYDLRHTAATLLLRAGVNPKVTSERLGHSSVAFTMDVYSASLPDLQEEAACKLEAILGRGN